MKDNIEEFVEELFREYQELGELTRRILHE